MLPYTYEHDALRRAEDRDRAATERLARTLAPHRPSLTLHLANALLALGSRLQRAPAPMPTDLRDALTAPTSR